MDQNETSRVRERAATSSRCELCHLQTWVKEKGLRVVVVFEGRDGAGKGGTIRAITERLSPRVSGSSRCRRRPIARSRRCTCSATCSTFPAAGEVVIFDRSWYNRAGVEHVMGFCTQEAARAVPRAVPEIEKFIVDGGIILIKLWLEVGDEEQKRRFEARIKDPVRQWKLSPMDLPSRERWYEYSRARDMMLKATDTEMRAVAHRAARTTRRRARLNTIAHLLKHPLQEAAAPEGQVAEALEQGQVRRRGVDRQAKVRPEKY